MRPGFAVLFLAAVLLGPPAFAAPYTPVDKPRVDFWRSNNMPQKPPKEPTAADQRFGQAAYNKELATRLGVVDGTAEIFRYDLDKNSAAKASVDGGFGGHGVRLRMRW